MNFSPMPISFKRLFHQIHLCNSRVISISYSTYLFSGNTDKVILFRKKACNARAYKNLYHQWSRFLWIYSNFDIQIYLGNKKNLLLTSQHTNFAVSPFYYRKLDSSKKQSISIKSCVGNQRIAILFQSIILT